MRSILLFVILSTLVLIIAVTHTVNGKGRGCGRGGPPDDEYGSGGRPCKDDVECCSVMCHYYGKWEDQTQACTTYRGQTSLLNDCSRYGCHKGYCYAYCGLDRFKHEWCYTTESYSQSYKYVPCKDDHDCNGCWSCAGSCTL